MSRPLALITGGTSGLGLGIAKSLLAQHDLALVFAGDTERAQTALNELKGMNPEARVMTFKAKLAGETNCQALIQQIVAEFGTSPDVLVNSAGRLRDGLFMSLPAIDHQNMVEEHLLVPMFLAQICLKKMYRQKSGRIINLSSITARRAKKGQVNYTTVKAAIEGFTRSLALEVAHRGITVNAIAPGLIATPMTESLIQKITEAHGSLAKVIPAGSAGSPEDIGQLVAYLCSESGKYITGQTIDVDGGRGLGEV